MRHYAHYVKRTVKSKNTIFPPKSGESQQQCDGFNTPVFHSIPINSGVAARIKANDHIWIFSQLSSDFGVLPPSLDACIIVESIDIVDDGYKRFKFIADVEKSKWFPLFDATELISKLDTINAQNNTRPLLNTPTTAIGQALQFVREIADPTQLFLHANKLAQLQPEFISYRIKDGMLNAFMHAKSLLEKQTPILWDRWSLPRRLTERDEEVDAVKLDQSIVDMINRSTKVWGIYSELYAAEKSYSKLEMEMAKRLGKFQWANRESV
jgi:hypothetical protein